jgi:phosphoribosylanthranilate isomerase
MTASAGTMTWVKFCATTNLRDAEHSIEAGAHALGFVFAPSTRRMDLAPAAQIVAALPPEIEKIGVVVNQSPSDLANLADRVGLTGLQLHGDEAPELMPEYRRALSKRKLIKALQARQVLDSKNGMSVVDSYLAQRDELDAILLDSGSPTVRGGTGKTFDWQAALPIVVKIREQMPIIIAGGLTPDNVSDAIRLFEPWGVDVVSGVEREVGKKDQIKLRAFIAAVRAALPDEVGEHSQPTGQPQGTH